MTKLQNMLYSYAEENLFSRCCGDDLGTLRQSEQKAEALMEQLKGAGRETEQWAEQLRFEWGAADSLHTQALFLAGLSMGLELGRLGHGA